MLANALWVFECSDLYKLLFWQDKVRDAAQSFAGLFDRFRAVPTRSRTASVLRHEVNRVLAIQSGQLLCDCWRHGMFTVYRPSFFVPTETDAELSYVFSWHSFIRWHLAPMCPHRFRPDWQSEFVPWVDQIRGDHGRVESDLTTDVSDDRDEVLVWRLDLCADVQATACAILVEELERLREAVEQRLGQLSGDPRVGDDVVVRLLNVYTNGLADERLKKASSILNSNRTLDEKLWEIDGLMRIPANASAQSLGDALGVSKTAVQKTSWYDQKRKGRRDEEIAQREDRLHQRGQEHETERQTNDDD